MFPKNRRIRSWIQILFQVARGNMCKTESKTQQRILKSVAHGRRCRVMYVDSQTSGWRSSIVRTCFFGICAFLSRVFLASAPVPDGLLFYVAWKQVWAHGLETLTEWELFMRRVHPIGLEFARSDTVCWRCRRVYPVGFWFWSIRFTRMWQKSSSFVGNHILRVSVAKQGSECHGGAGRWCTV